MTRPFYALLIFAAGGLSGCTRAGENLARMQIQMPPHPSVSAKSTNYTPQSDAFAFCYMVNITGDGIKPNKLSCYPDGGGRTSFLPPLANASLEVDRGANRRVELFGYVPRAGETCATVGLDLQNVPLNRLFLLASQPNVAMNDPEVTVKLNVVFPGLANHVGVQSGVDPSCYATLPPVVLPEAPPLASVFRGQRFVMTANVAGDGRPTPAQGSRFKVTHEVVYVR